MKYPMRFSDDKNRTPHKISSMLKADLKQSVVSTRLIGQTLNQKLYLWAGVENKTT